ncbi:MAG: ribonuclease P protein component [bacterium]|nr:ribonuclease P protein component [bacterium]
MNATLGPQNRLKKRRDFLLVQRTGIKAQGHYLTIIAKPIHSHHEGRIGFTVSKAVGKAHVRNLIKRRLRHIIRENRDQINRFDLVIIAYPNITTASFEQIQTDLLKTIVFLKQKVLSRTKKMGTKT